MQKSVVTIIGCAVVVLFSFLLYFKTLNYEFVLDDRIAITENSVVRKGAEAYKEVFEKSFYAGANNKNKNVYRPITSLTFAVNVDMQDVYPEDPPSALDPKPFRTFNLFIHSISCVLIFLLLYQEVFRDNFALSFIVTLLFVVHPIHTEVVANIKSRDELLGLFGVVGSMYLLLKGIRLEKIELLIIGYLVFALGVFSKESIITFSVIIPLSFYFFRDLSWKRILLLTAPLIFISVSYLIIRTSVLDEGIVHQQALIQNGLVQGENVVERLPTNFVMLGKYLSILTIPTSLSADYSYNAIPFVGWGNVWAWISIILHLGIAYLVVTRFKRKDPLVFAILFYYISISVVSNVIILIGAQFAERFVFLPSLGFCIAVGLLLVRIGEKLLPEKLKERVIYGVAGIIIIIFSGLTSSRNEVWQSNETLHRATIKDMPTSARAHYFFAADIFNKGNKISDSRIKKELYDSAEVYYGNAVRICPEFGTAWYFLGQSHFLSGDSADAYSCYQEFIRLEGPNAKAYNTMGVIKGMAGDLDSSRYYLSEAVKVGKKKEGIEYGEALSNLGKTYLQMAFKDSTEKRFEYFRNAQKCFERALNSKTAPAPDILDVRKNLEFIKLQLKENNRAGLTPTDPK